MNRYKDLLKYCRSKKIRVRHVPSRQLMDYAGMNDEAAKKLGFKRLPNKTILIDRRLPVKTKLKTLRHEVVEMGLMEKGEPYWRAHRTATRRERRGIL